MRCNLGGTRTLYKSSEWYEEIKSLGITDLGKKKLKKKITTKR